MNQRTLPLPVKILLLYVVYVGAGKLALSSELLIFAETLTWLPAGIGLAGLLAWGNWSLLAIGAGAFSITVWDGGPKESGAVTALAHVAGSFAGTYCLRRFTLFRNTIDRVNDAVALACLGSGLGSAITATLGAGLLKYRGRFPETTWDDLWWLWWRGDSLAVLLVTPLLLVWLARPWPVWNRKRAAEALGLGLGLTAVSMTVFGLLPFGKTEQPFAFLHFPLLMWAAIRFGVHGAVSANGLILAFTALGTLRGLGPFVADRVEQTLLLHWAFLGATSLASLLLATTVEQSEQAEAEARDAEDRYRAFMEQSTEGIWRLELAEPLNPHWPEERQVSHLIQHNQIAECNDAFARMYGYSRAAEMLGIKVQDLMPVTDEHNVRFMQSLIRSGYRISEAESRERDREGNPKFFLNTVVGILDSGKLVRLWGTQRDITERRRLEDQLRQAQKMEAVGRLAGGVAHDFNNLLMVIGGHGELLLDEAAADSSVRRHTEAILRAAERAGTLTRQLLAFSRKQVLQPKVLDLNAVVMEVAKLLKRLIGEHIELTFSLAPNLGQVKADPGQIEQVLMNLTLNARDAMPDGGRLTIETRDVEITEEYRREHPAAVPGPYVLLSVSDTGMGMDTQTRAQIFEPFFTTKGLGKGTGLGLATVYGIVKQSGGYIWVYSEPGHGSSFKVYIPRVTHEEEAAPAGSEPAPLPGGTETVLLSEDEPAVRELARDFLITGGYTVLEARDAQDAIRLASQAEGNIQLLLTDVVMPGMKGTELAVRVAQLQKSIRVLYISGYTDDAAIHHGVNGPASAFLSKPFAREALLRKVREVLDN